ncbi:hypothetical protein BU14_1012s0001 [Porphyra umbilicalis]|uniref:Uncharacterized protein n=1 Tax=Porphyra umbilicalis TaxID=2786 RepID=A0A1X6NMR6_PORUM|nr:hypothetical protein BU14_1012s0001 [Porphyra umbilicalis]|eukprot:OSX69914.1 hypothetical protein BU14_1012s0001 [Porphyra umbilicalis]
MSSSSIAGPTAYALESTRRRAVGSANDARKEAPTGPTASARMASGAKMSARTPRLRTWSMRNEGLIATRPVAAAGSSDHGLKQRNAADRVADGEHRGGDGPSASSPRCHWRRSRDGVTSAPAGATTSARKPRSCADQYGRSRRRPRRRHRACPAAACPTAQSRANLPRTRGSRRPRTPARCAATAGSWRQSRARRQWPAWPMRRGRRRPRRGTRCASRESRTRGRGRPRPTGAKRGRRRSAPRPQRASA